MRTYFLLGAVAMLMTTTANATNPIAAGAFLAQAAIVMADSITCNEDLTMVAVTDDSKSINVTINPDGSIERSAHLIHIEGTPAKCTISNGVFTNIDNFSVSQETVVFEPSSESDTAPTLSDFTFAIANDGTSVSIGGNFYIDSPTSSSTYTSIVSVMYSYE
ncbi:MAG: hypothetical protein IJ019_00905 [Alphaproteobacteria bacterium]|nr:hypothetical protein [Alphaproteobacteria bacterium]